MTNSTQLLGISNAIVDILAHVDHALIEEMGIVPGSMNLIDEERAREIYDMMGPATEMSGGSVANGSLPGQTLITINARARPITVNLKIKLIQLRKVFIFIRDDGNQ